MKLPVERRLCTLALSRRLGLAVPDHKLATLAGYWAVPQQRAHDAIDDVEVPEPAAGGFGSVGGAQ